MKSKDVLKLLKITRPTLSKYVKNGKLTVKLLPNGFYDYDKKSVYALFDKTLERNSVIYCRVSTNKQKNDLINQENTLKEFCFKNNIIISDIYKDIGSGINFDRKEFNRLINNVINRKIDVIYITYKDRLSRISFSMFENLFSEFDCKIIVLNQINDEKIIEKEIFNEIIGLIHCFSMKVYSNRRKEKLKLIEKELIMEDDL
jgi:predicted site-specific integrase-resolvase